MAWDFRPGMKVVCINDDCEGARHPLLERGRIYTVAGLGEDWGIAHDNKTTITGPVVWLREIEHAYDDGNFTVGPDFWTSQFRPLVERKTSIEIFKAMLNPQRHSENA